VIALPFAALALVCVLFIREVPRRTTILREDEMTHRRTLPETVDSSVAR
jgi:hypothetical protein